MRQCRVNESDVLSAFNVYKTVFFVSLAVATIPALLLNWSLRNQTFVIPQLGAAAKPLPHQKPLVRNWNEKPPLYFLMVLRRFELQKFLDRGADLREGCPPVRDCGRQGSNSRRLLSPRQRRRIMICI